MPTPETARAAVKRSAESPSRLETVLRFRAGRLKMSQEQWGDYSTNGEDATPLSACRARRSAATEA